jgi:hypothetical protein
VTYRFLVVARDKFKVTKTQVGVGSTVSQPPVAGLSENLVRQLPGLGLLALQDGQPGEHGPVPACRVQLAGFGREAEALLGERLGDGEAAVGQ